MMPTLFVAFYQSFITVFLTHAKNCRFLQLLANYANFLSFGLKSPILFAFLKGVSQYINETYVYHRNKNPNAFDSLSRIKRVRSSFN